MRSNLSNAAYGVIDYASYPVGMLLVAPAILHRVGAAEYGLWMIAGSVVSAGGIIASGFGDAGIQQVARLRGGDDIRSMENTVQSLLVTHLTLGLVLMLAVWLLAPVAAYRFVAGHGPSLRSCIACLRVAGIGILIRAVETVPVCVQRAFEVYRGTVQISVATRALTLAGAVVVAARGGRSFEIMLLTVVLMGIGTVLQFLEMRHFVSPRCIQLQLRPRELRRLLSSGIFLWIQTLGSVVFCQFDRIAVGLFLGAATVVPYAMSIQLSEPLFGLTASCLSFFFPYLVGRAGTLSHQELKQTVLKAFFCNVLLVTSGAALLFLFGSWLMRAWAGVAVEQSTHTILPLVILGSSLSGLSVVGVYAAQALGMFRVIACISLASRTAVLFLMLFLLQHNGLIGLAIARACYGAAALLVYLPLVLQFRFFEHRSTSATDLLQDAGLEKGVRG